MTLKVNFIITHETNTWNVRKISHCFLYRCNNIANFYVLVDTSEGVIFEFIFTISFVTVFS